MKIFKPFAMLATLAAISLPASGQLSLVTSRATFPTTDTVDWAQLPLLNADGTGYDMLMSPFTIATTGGSTVAVSHDPLTFFERVNEGNGWHGNFPAGDALLWNSGDNGSVTFDPANLIFGAGFNFQANVGGPFTVRLDAYGVNGHLLGSVSRSGISSNSGSALFIGFMDPLAEVDKFVASLIQGTGGLSDFAINMLALSAGPQTEPAIVAVPEPSTYGLMGTLVILGLAGRQRLRRHSET